MSDEQAPPPEAPPEAPEQTSEPVFTQADLDAASAKARSQGERQGRKKALQVAPTPTKEPTTDAGDQSPPAWAQAIIDGQADLKSRIAAKESADAFSSAVSGVTLSETETKLLKLAFENDRDLFDSQIAAKLSVDQPPPATGQGFTSAGAPAAAPREVDMQSIVSWTRDDVATMKKAGTFRENLKKARGAMPGGSGGLFPAKK